MKKCIIFLSREVSSRKSTKALIITTLFFALILLSSLAEAKSYKVIVGYENEEMEVNLIPGRKVPLNGEMPSPSSSVLNSKFPPPKNVQTFVPGANPVLPSSPRDPVDYAPSHVSFAVPPSFGIPTAQDLQAIIDATGRVTVRGVTFDYDSAAITPSSIPALQAMLEYLKSNPGVRITIEGHCDTSGDTSLNPALSQGRAQAVKDWVVSHGADGSNLQAIGRGDTQPIADNGTAEGRAMNRRVDLVKG
ncbi:MAG: OmpA family protein [Candidatus Ozemobacteraceae bacterium]